MNAQSIFPQSGTSPDQAAEPLLQTFNHFQSGIDALSISGAVVRKFAEEVADVASGVRTLMQLLIEEDNRRTLRESSEGPPEVLRPILGEVKAWHLARLGVYALDALDRHTGDLMEWAAEKCKPSAPNTKPEPVAPLQPQEMTGWRDKVCALVGEVVKTIEEARELDTGVEHGDFSFLLDHAQQVCDRMLQEAAHASATASDLLGSSYELMAIMRAGMALEGVPKAIKLLMQEAVRMVDAASESASGDDFLNVGDSDPGHIRVQGGRQ